MKGVLTIGILLLAAALLVLPVSGAFTVTDISPDKGTNTGVVLVTISGTDLPADAGATLVMALQPDITAFSVIGVDGTKFIAAFDLAGVPAGDRAVVVVNKIDGSEAILEGHVFAIENPPPTLSGVSPGSGINNEDALDLSVSGNNFLPGARVDLVSGSSTLPATVSSVTSSGIACTVNLTGAAAGLWSVKVTNTDGKSATLPLAFNVVNPGPTIASIAPATGKNNAIGAFEVAGTGFMQGASVALTRTGETPIGTIGTPGIEPGRVQCMFNLTGAKAGTWDVVVTNPDLQSCTLAGGFFVMYPAAPQPLAITPSSGVNIGTVAITNLSGTGFEEGASVALHKGALPPITGTDVKVVGHTLIACGLDLSTAEKGAWDVVVTNNDGQSGVLAGGFQVLLPAPQVTGISPASGLNNGVVSISNLSGNYFRPDATVKLTAPGEPDIPAANVKVETAGKITCSFDLAGKNVTTWNVVVTNEDGQSAMGEKLFRTENPPPEPSAITPSKGPNDRSVVVSALNGKGFLPGATVQLTRNGLPPLTATGVSVTSPSVITCTLDLAGRATGKWNVVVTNPDGKAGAIPNGFTVTPPPPVPNFTANPVYGTSPLTVQFTDLSTNMPYLWSWNFGDGFTVTGLDQQSPVHTYNEPGAFNVTLRVRGEGGEVEVTRQNYITVVLTPVAQFTATPKSGPAPLLVQFTDSSDGEPLKYAWQFGDRGTSKEKNPYHLYTVPGTYTVTLTVSNNEGSDTTTDQIEVTALPVAEFSANVTSGESPLAVQFTDMSTGEPTSWVWKFGDGGTSLAKNPVHVFADPGVYSVQLSVFNTHGNNTLRKDGYIAVGQAVHADFEFTTSNPKNVAPLLVAFTDRSAGKVMKWSWSFGDRYTSDERNPIHYYAEPGEYNITLTVTGTSGSDSVTKKIVVTSPLDADFIAEPTAGSVPLTVVLSDTSVGTIVERTWIVSKDSGNIIFNRPGAKDQVYTFNEPGVYTVTMNVVDTFGTPDSKERKAYITVLPFPE